MRLNISDKATLKTLSEKIIKEINLFCEKDLQDDFRTHLGASQIGNNCERASFYAFRWFYNKKFSGRALRLFDRGKIEEERFIKWLKGAGFTINEFDFENNMLLFNPESSCYYTEKIENKESIDFSQVVDVSEIDHHIKAAVAHGVKIPQFKISDCSGHFGGSLDGEGFLPDFAQCDEKILFEFKTSGTGSGFTNLIKNGVVKEKPLHFSQMCVYGLKRNIKLALYLVTNKNDDDIYPELVELDWILGQKEIDKASRIIFAKNLPEKISLKSTNFECKMCNFYEICHGEEVPAKNCRSCIFSNPVINKQWNCEKYGIIPSEFISKGCDNWSCQWI